MNKPKIGIKLDPDYFSWDSEIFNKFDTIELASRDKALKFNIKKILEAKEILKNKDLSMHTQTSRVFSCKQHHVPEFSCAEIKILEAEIILCKLLGAKELIFHMKNEKLDEEEAKIFKKLLKFAKKNGVEMIFESNNQFFGETAVDTLKRFPKLNYNLDLGHFNIGITSRELGMMPEEFLSKIKNRIVYIHAHNNNGKLDEHNGIDEGTLDWKHILDLLNFKKVRKIIMEVRNPEAVEKSKKLLDDYFEKK